MERSDAWGHRIRCLLWEWRPSLSVSRGSRAQWAGGLKIPGLSLNHTHAWLKGKGSFFAAFAFAVGYSLSPGEAGNM